MTRESSHMLYLEIHRSEWRKIRHIGLLFLLLIAVLWISVEMVVQFRELTILFVLSILLAYLLDPLVGYLETFGLSRGVSTLIVFAVLAGFIGWALVAFLPAVSSQASSITHYLQSGKISGMVSNWDKLLKERLAFLGNPEMAQNISEKVQSWVVHFQEGIFKFALGLFSTLTDLVIIPFITFFLIKDGPAMKKAFIQTVPNRYFEMSLNLVYKTNKQLGNYIRGQMIDAFLVGVLSVIALFFLHIDYYVLIGSIAGLANMIPYFGPIVGAVPAMIVSLSQNPSLMPLVWIAVAFAVIQLIDNVFISPLVVAKSVDLHPLLVVVVVLIGGQLLGILGMLLAVPVTSILNVIIREVIFGFRNYRILD